MCIETNWSPNLKLLWIRDKFFESKHKVDSAKEQASTVYKPPERNNISCEIMTIPEWPVVEKGNIGVVQCLIVIFSCTVFIVSLVTVAAESSHNFTHSKDYKRFR